MPQQFPERTSAFNHTHLRTETRLLIQSACKQCGAAKLVSVHDGSLQSWEHAHECKNQPARDPIEQRGAA